MHGNTLLDVGSKAPYFSLKATPNQAVSLADFTGQPVVLVFYPANFNPVCNDTMALYNEVLPEFHQHNAQVLGISVDNVWSHLEFARERNLHFPLLSDFHPKGEVSKRYNVYHEDIGEADRAIYVIDKNGLIAWGYVAPIGINPGADGALKALEDLSTGEQ